MDYDNKELVDFFFKEIVSYLKVIKDYSLESILTCHIN